MKIGKHKLGLTKKGCCHQWFTSGKVTIHAVCKFCNEEQVWTFRPVKK